MDEKIGSSQEHSAAKLLSFARRARHIEDANALKFMLVNETFGLASFRISVLWLAGQGVLAQSGVSHVDPNSPFITWLSKVCDTLSGAFDHPVVIEPGMFNEQDVLEWEQSLPAHALWIPFNAGKNSKAGFLVARDETWSELDFALLSEWVDIWSFSWNRLQGPSLQSRFTYSLNRIGSLIPTFSQTAKFIRDVGIGLKYFLFQILLRPGKWVDGILCACKSIGTAIRRMFGNGVKGTLFKIVGALLSLWKSKKVRYWLLFFLIVFFPVRLTILAPAELVPFNPAVIRVPIDGVVDEFFVLPNQQVREGQPLFKLDLTTLTSRLQVAQQEMQIASTEYRQSSLQSLTDPKSRSLLNPQEGKASEKQIEADYLKKLLDKAQIIAPRNGIALFDDPSAWIGKPVAAGEKVMVVATEGLVEIEAWIPLNEAIELEPNTPVTMYLNTSPLNPVAGIIRYLGHEAILRPDGTYAYRMRARIDQDEHSARIGLRGTAKISGKYVPFSYWMLRKPLAALRQFVGF
ncbi:HlyD family efflux transporter periplasmic adaptor subunit [Orrella sp. NBD-18]|uniref:HlyD family efflux transporter periplasmic adaptor subunit n=1 Tax=Sheuella amnicola TaxID=2707330 RepID=A0A6B2R4Q6_9BURK|nr:HlyD family efflux transporter periplasmic adaptor subunit [Sheuella amnicola]NDY84027.1 HlyD family efflux transporter periplasmic adaptor subunit [Sheuella amnicola]HBI83267.1 hypothetical protein [Alcaligenaceae bacterium]